MNAGELNAAADAAGQRADETHAENLELLKLLNAMPGGKEMMRRELAKLNISSEQFEQLLKGEVQPSDIPGLLGMRIPKN